MSLHGTVVTYLLKYNKNSEQEIEHDIDSAIKWSLYTFDIHEIYSTFDEYCNL